MLASTATSCACCQAKSAILFLYREVLEIELPWLDEVVRAKKSQRLPSVLTRAEVTLVLERMDGVYGLMARLLYGTGMRLMECCRLRVKDVDFGQREILIREGKGAKDRVTMLPDTLVQPLQEFLAKRRRLYDDDLAKSMAEVFLPDALARKYPNAANDWAWQYVFPSGSYSVDPRRILCVTPSPRTFWKTATTLEPCRNCSVIPMFPTR